MFRLHSKFIFFSITLLIFIHSWQVNARTICNQFNIKDEMIFSTKTTKKTETIFLQSEQQDEIKRKKQKSMKHKKKIQSKPTIRDEILPKFEIQQLIPPKLDSTFISSFTKLKDVNDLAPEQAFEQYNQLIGKYPALRESIMRQMIAGPNCILTKPNEFDLQIDRWTKNPKWLKLNEYAWFMKRNMISPYDPLHGFDRDKKLGIQLNLLYISLMLLLIKILTE